MCEKFEFSPGRKVERIFFSGVPCIYGLIWIITPKITIQYSTVQPTGQYNRGDTRLKKNRGFFKFNENRIVFERLIFKTLIIQKPSLGSCKVPHKIQARSV